MAILKQCSRCGLCREVCPFKVIDVTEEKGAILQSEKKQLCLTCGQCMAVCPTRFIQVDGLSYGENLADIQPIGFKEEDFSHFLASRRSVRNFDGREVPKEMIQKVLHAVQYAPFGCHPEKSAITVVNNRETIELSLPLISRFLDLVVHIIENPMISFFFRRSSSAEVYNTVKNHLYPIARQGTFKLDKGDRISRGAPLMILFHSEKTAEARTANALLNATYAMLQAHALGLGSTLVEIVPSAINQVKELKSLFQIPQDHEVNMSLVLGFPKYKYRRSISRPLQSINWIGNE